MKKIYNQPCAKIIRLNHAENVLLTMSQNDGPGEIEGGMTRDQKPSNGNSLWDSWSN